MARPELTLPLVGRTQELTKLRAAFDDVRSSGHGSLVVIQGGPGLGKSRLLDEALKRFSGGFLALRGSGSEINNEVPLLPLRDALAARLGGEDSINEDSDEISIPTILDLLEECALLQPTVVALEDLHWFDAETVVALERINRRLEQLALLVIVTTRPKRANARADRLVLGATSHKSQLIELPPLDRESVKQMLAALPGHSPITASVMEGGNPLFILEAVAHHEMLPERFEPPFPEGTEAVDRFTSLVKAHMSRLPAATVEFLQVASLLGNRFSLTDVASVAEEPASSLLGASRQAEAENFIVPLETDFVFRHDLIRDAIYAGLPSPTRRALHRQAAFALMRDHANPVHVVPHMIRGARKSNDSDLRLLFELGIGASSISPRTGVDVLESALALDPSPSLETAISTELIDLLMWAGQLQDAEDLAKDLLLRGVAPEREERVRIALSHALHLQGNTSGAIEELEEVLARTAANDTKASAHAWLCLAYQQRGDWHLCREHAQRALELAASDHHLPRCQAHIALGLAEEAAGNVGKALEHVRSAAAIANESIDPEVHRMSPALYLGIAMRTAGQHRDALSVLQHGLARADRLGVVWPLPSFYCVLGWTLIEMGELDEAEAELEAGVLACEETGSEWAKSFLLPLLARIHLSRNQLELAQRRLDAAEVLVTPSSPEAPPLYTVWLRVVRAMLLDALGRHREALGEAKEGWRVATESGQLSLRLLYAGPLLRLASISDARTAEQWADGIHEIARIMVTRSSLGIADWVAAVTSRDAEGLVMAAADLAATSHQLAAAFAAEEAGIASAPGAQAVELLKRSAETFRQSGATRDLARVSRRLRDLGVRRRPASKPARPAYGWDALTDSQAQVVELIVEGLTYQKVGERLFISRRTVETHAKHAFEKLGVSSRAELAGWYARHRAGGGNS